MQKAAGDCWEALLANCLRFANPAEAIGGRHSEAWRLRCVEAQKLVDLGSFLDLLDGFWRTSKIFVL